VFQNHSLKSPLKIQTPIHVEWLNSFSIFENFVSRKGFYFSHGYLNALVTGAGERGRFLYPTIVKEGETIAAGCFQELVLYRDELDDLGRLFSSDSKLTLAIESILKSLVQLGKEKKGIRILIAGNCQVTGPYGVCFSPSITEQEKAQCWTSILKEAETQFGPYSIVLVKDFTSGDHFIIDNLMKEGYRKIPTLPVMHFDLHSSWKNFDDYTAALASKYRIRTKAARKKFSPIHTEIWNADQIQEHDHEINALYQHVFSKARFRLYRINTDYFVKLKVELGEHFQFKVYLNNDVLIGFTTFFIGENQSDAHLIGIDYSANKQFSLYQNMLYDYIEEGIKVQTKSIDFGRTAMEIKSTIGAVPVESQVLVKMRNPLLNGLACLLMDSSSPAPWIQRHPFRED
jgi:hypothetical protein